MKLVELGGVHWIEHELVNSEKEEDVAKRMPFGLKADCSIEVVSGACLFRGAGVLAAPVEADDSEAMDEGSTDEADEGEVPQRCGNAASACVRHKYQMNDSTVWDVLLAFGTEPCRFRVRYESAPRKYRRNVMNVFTVLDTWKTSAEVMAERVGPEANGDRLAAVVCGPARVGKSSFVNYLTNFLVSLQFLTHQRRAKYNTVAVIDADLGQPIRGAPGLVSITLHQSPDLGSSESYTQSYVVGTVTADGNEVEYIRAVQNVHWIYTRYQQLMEDEYLPLIVNCAGWTVNMGAQLIDVISGIVQATDLVHLTHPIEGVTVPVGVTPGLLPGANLNEETINPLYPVIKELGLGPGPFPYLHHPNSGLLFTHEVEPGPPPVDSAAHGIGTPTTRPSSSVPIMTASDRRYFRLARILFSKRMMLRCATEDLTAAYLSHFVAGNARPLKLAAISFVNTGFSRSAAAQHLDFQLNGHVVYVTQNNWLKSLGVVTDVDEDSRLCHLYVPDPSVIDFSTKASGVYTLLRYPENGMNELVASVRVWKKSLTIAHDQRSSAQQSPNKAGVVPAV